MNETELLFTEVLNCSREKLYLDRKRILTQEESRFLAFAIKRRIKGEPLQYILGKTEFMGLEFKLKPPVFIPRPETEILVETTINIVKLLNCHIVKLLDIGTGSGNIAISLAKSFPSAEVVATDISKEALEVARKNALLNNVKINFLESDLFSNTELSSKKYDLIVSNPPYIPRFEIENLEAELNYESRIALDGGIDGLDFYRRIIKESSGCLKNDGFLILEIGFNQCQTIKELFKSVEEFKITKVVKDYNDIDRVIVVRLK